MDYHTPECNWTSSRPHRGFLHCIAGGESQEKDSFKAAVSDRQKNKCQKALCGSQQTASMTQGSLLFTAVLLLTQFRERDMMAGISGRRKIERYLQNLTAE